VLRLAADENFNNDVIRGLIRRQPNLDIVRVQDAGLSGANDAAILDWAADDGRVLLTHDVTTMTAYALRRAAGAQPMPGVFEVGMHLSIAQVIDDLLLLAECSLEDEWEGQIRYLPL
jgi:hypothetical protein